MPAEREKINISEKNAKLALLLSNSAEEANASKSQTSDFCEHNKISVGNKRERKRGRKRKGYSMGTYPFLSAALRYLEDQKPFLAEITVKTRERKFRYLNREFVKLWKAGKLTTTNPKRFTEKDIGAILLWMREKGLDPATQETYIDYLTRVLRHCGNAVLDRMKEKRIPFPKEIPKEIKTLSEQEIQYIQKTAENIAGWRGEILRFIVPMYAYTGLRPSELRLAQIQDVDTTTWTIWIRHPKGENKYARQRTVPIPSPARFAVVQYLKARKEQLEKHGIQNCEQLIPHFIGNSTSYYTDRNFWLLKHKLEKISGLQFKLKDFRSSYAQNLKDKGVSIEAVSKALGHSSTKTTERYYARIRDSSMFKEINRAWEEPQNQVELNPKKAQMKNENWLSGYA
ncbi:MAG: site-specific integrase [Candidatus Thermoplasmatota archaeon]